MHTAENNGIFILETERLILRRQTMDDVPFLIDLWSVPSWRMART